MTRRPAAALVAVLLALPLTLTACDTACPAEGATRTRRTGHGTVHERCTDGRWKETR